jgi:hypothetical protein
VTLKVWPTRKSTEARGCQDPRSNLLTCCRVHSIRDASSLCFHPLPRRSSAIRSPICLPTASWLIENLASELLRTQILRIGLRWPSLWLGQRGGIHERRE